MKNVFDFVESRSGVTADQLISLRGNRYVAHVRRVTCYLLHAQLPSMSEVARVLKRRPDTVWRALANLRRDPAAMTTARSWHAELRRAP